MKSKSLIIVLILIIILFGGYIGYDLLVVHKNAENEKSNNNEYDKKAIVVSAYEKSKKYFVKAEDNCNNEDLNLTYTVKIPKINSNTLNAINFNKKIYNDYLDEINFLKKDKLIGEEIGNRDTDYNYIVKNDIVYIIIKDSYGVLCGGGDTSIKLYYYDVKNDKELTTKEIYRINNITEDDIKNEFMKYYNEEYFPNPYDPDGLYYIVPVSSFLYGVFNDYYSVYFMGPISDEEVIFGKY